MELLKGADEPLASTHTANVSLTSGSSGYTLGLHSIQDHPPNNGYNSQTMLVNGQTNQLIASESCMEMLKETYLGQEEPLSSLELHTANYTSSEDTNRDNDRDSNHGNTTYNTLTPFVPQMLHGESSLPTECQLTLTSPQGVPRCL